MAKDTEYVLKTEVLEHTAGTKKYGLVTLIDPTTDRAAGLQLWGPTERFKDHKFITGRVEFVGGLMNSKRQEKMKARKDGAYLQGAALTEQRTGPAAISVVRSFLMVEGCDSTTAKELADKLFQEIGANDNLEALSAEVAEATTAAKMAREEAARAAAAQREAAYDGTWGAW